MVGTRPVYLSVWQHYQTPPEGRRGELLGQFKFPWRPGWVWRGRKGLASFGPTAFIYHPLLWLLLCINKARSFFKSDSDLIQLHEINTLKNVAVPEKKLDVCRSWWQRGEILLTCQNTYHKIKGRGMHIWWRCSNICSPTPSIFYVCLLKWQLYFDYLRQSAFSMHKP